MSFRFRLEKVLAWRRRETEDRRLELGHARAELQAAEAALEQARQDFVALQERWQAQAHRPVDALTLRAREAAARASLERISACEATVQAQRHQVETARARLVEAHRREQTLERLRERQLKKWQLEESAQERRASADLPRRSEGFPIVPEETRSFR